MKNKKSYREAKLGKVLSQEKTVEAIELFKQWYDKKWDRVYKKDFYKPDHKRLVLSGVNDKILPGVDWEYESWLLRKIGIDASSIVTLMATGNLYL